MALGHLGINVGDLQDAKRYYDQMMPLLGYEPFLSHDDELAYRPAAGKYGTYLFFYPATDARYDPDMAGLQHLAFMMPSRPDVDRAAELATSLGSEIVHQPQEWPQYPPPYYATFWHGPDGVLLEAVCHKDAST